MNTKLEQTLRRNHAMWSGDMIFGDNMNRVCKVVPKDKGIGVVVNERVETISEGITRLNIGNKNDKRKLRSK
ncbi:MAG: hypothetical protein KKD39_00910 [Candidatus Altiarchaeota archaeon]|nr:hypothetical protein [Candidatus Altiarchaeota archaeon]